MMKTIRVNNAPFSLPNGAPHVHLTLYFPTELTKQYTDSDESGKFFFILQ